MNVHCKNEMPDSDLDIMWPGNDWSVENGRVKKDMKTDFFRYRIGKKIRFRETGPILGNSSVMSDIHLP